MKRSTVPRESSGFSAKVSLHSLIACDLKGSIPFPLLRHTGKVIERGTPEFDALMRPESGSLDYPTPAMQPGARAIIWLDIERVSVSHEPAVPLYNFEGHRKSNPEPYRALHSLCLV